MFQNVFKYENNLTVSGLNESLINEYINNYFLSNDRDILVVTNSLYEANRVYKSIHEENKSVYFFPMDEFATATAISTSPDLKIVRIETLNSLDKKKKIIITNLTGYLKKIDKKENKLIINFDTKREEIINFLENNSYIKTNLVSTTGEYAIRNFIIDIYPINYNNPVRIEFFGSNIDSMRIFDEESQISKNTINNIVLYSFSDNNNIEKESIFNKLKNPLIFFIDYKNIIKSYEEYLLNIKNNTNADELFSDFDKINVNNKIYINKLDDISIDKSIIKYESRDLINFNNNFDKLYEYVEKERQKNIIVFMLSNEILINKIIKLFGNNISFNTYTIGKVNIHNKNISKGYIFNNYIVISEYDIENIKRNADFVTHYNIGRKIKGFEDLKKGDYIVHISHGIGQYQGLVTLDNKGTKKDYLLIKYAGNDKVYIPAQKIETIYKYSDSDITVPKLNSLGNNLWLKTKVKVREKIKDISGELIELYAKREMVKCDKYNSIPEEEIFNNDFMYSETPDQLNAIEDILKDLESDKPMDRLLCGDVGFGKTEVAMRAMFRTVMNNRQVSYLCPTTILSKQQYENAIKRFRHFPVNIELLNRFTSTKDVARIEQGLENGTVDILIGTHKILNSNIIFKNLGLLVIDEEQRFGVSQKEKIKKLRNNVNVLTLSATPIPRTLKLAMSGIKDMSVIDTAPINRYPIQTYVLEENDYILKDAIYKELARDGQTYILLNNIKDLDEEFNKINSLVPEAKICIAHGRMEKNKLNQVVSDFIDGIYNVLLCTTIIETGIDIPNVNTLIIKNADRFGLSQLYQIRGRVGRSDRIAYAYMMYEKNKFLNDIAIKRLQTIKDFTELGSGYKIAMRDLAIRGAGELLGSSQSGFISSVGIDLYIDMVNDEINKLKGVEKNEVNDSEKNLLNISTTIEDKYVDDESLKIEIHKLINEINSKESFLKVKNEIEDRFGKVNNDLINYMYEEWFQNVADELNIENIKYIGNDVEITFDDKISSNVDGEKLFLQIYSINNKFKIKHFNKRLIISLNIINRSSDYVRDLLQLLLLIKTCIKDN